MREPCHPFVTRIRHSGPPGPQDEERRCDGRPDDRAAPRRVLAVRPRPLPDPVRRAVAEIAGAAGAWCPALSPEGDRVAYVTDRSGIPRLEVARLDGGTPTVCPGPREEVVSVAWSPDGGRLAYLVSPGGSICAELHVVRPDGTDHRVVAGEDPRATVFAGGWTGAGALRLLDRARRRAGRRHRPGRRRHRRAPHARHRRLPVGHRGVGRRAVRAGPPRAPRPPAHRRRSTSPPGCSAGRWRLDAPGGVASEDGRFGPDGRSLYLRASLPGAPFADRAGLVAIPLTEDGVPGEGRVVLSRPDADLDGYALRTDGTLLAVWNADGVTELLVHAVADGSVVRQIALPEPVLPGWSLSADGATMVAELTGPRRPRGLWVVPLTGAARPAPLPSAPPPARPGAAGDRRCATTTSPPTGCRCRAGSTRRADVAGPNRTVVSFHGGPEGQERPSWSPVAQSLVAAGFTVFAPNVRGSGGFGRAFTTADDGPAREASFADVRTTVDAAGRRRHRRARAGSGRTAGPTAAT